MFNNVLHGKKRFLHNKNVILTLWDKVHFSKEVNHDFRQKFEISSLSDFP